MMKRKMMRFTLSIIVVLLFASSVVFAAGENWTSVYGNPAHTGYSDSDAPDNNNIAWISPELSANLSSSVIVANGKIYVYCADGDMGGSSSSSIKCLDEADGSLLWTRVIEPAQYGSCASPVYDNGKVFIGSGQKAYAINGETGAIDWEYELALPVVNASPCAVDGKVVFGEWDPNHRKNCYYYCLNQNDGTLIWKFGCKGDIQGAVAYENGKFYGTAWESIGDHVYCINAETGAEIWHQEGLEYDTCGSVSLGAGKVFVTTYNFYGDGEVAALDAADGHIVWGPITIQRTSTCPAYHDGKLYVTGGCAGFSDLYTYCFNAGTGELIWQKEGVGSWTCSPAVADGKVFVGKPGNFFGFQGTYALNAETGETVWSSDKGGANPAVANGKVYTIGEDGKVYAFGAASTGEEPWDVNGDGSVNVLDMIIVGQHFGETGTPGWIAADVNGDGNVNVLDMILVGQHWD